MLKKAREAAAGNDGGEGKQDAKSAMDSSRSIWLAGLGAFSRAQVSQMAGEVASLGEAFGHAVQMFSASNDKLGAQLQRIEGALGRSMARSDEQLAYYVAQAREVIDLSTLSQRQIVEDLQRIAANQRSLAGSDA